jgi:phosphatidylglycerol:prolipoprotein diacylglycerol transferase
LHPILFKIGNFAIGSYGVIVAIAVICSIFIGRFLAKKEGIDPELITDFYIYSIIVGFVGAKVALIIADYKEFSQDPMKYLFENLRFFGAFYGGFIFAVIFALIYIRLKKLQFFKVADITAVSLPLGQSIGRWGCFFAGCCYGAPTKLPWGLVFPSVDICQDGTRIHPWPVYESILDLVIFVFLFLRFKKRRFRGESIFFYAMFYAVGRFLLEFLRGDEIRGLYFNKMLSLSQILSILVLIVAIPLYFYFLRRNKSGAN